MSLRNSSLVLRLLRKAPVKADVVVTEFCFCTPRICMHMCAASMTTATPRGFRVFWIQSLIWTVSLSWTWRTIWYIGDMAFSVEWQHVVLAHGIKLNVFYQYHLLILLFEHRRFEYGHRVKLISVSEKLHAFGNSFRSLENAFSGSVFAKKFQDFFVMRSQALCSLWREQFFLLICHTSVVICYKQGTKLQKMLPLPNNGFAKYRPSI